MVFFRGGFSETPKTVETGKLAELADQKGKPGGRNYTVSDGAGLYLRVTAAAGRL